MTFGSFCTFSMVPFGEDLALVHHGDLVGDVA